MSERWLPVVGQDGFYDVSDHGRVRTRHTRGGRRPSDGMLKLRLTKRGRVVVQLATGRRGGAPRFVHHLVLEAFVGPRPPGMEALHSDDNPQNNHVSNLRWGTRSENELDSVRNGHHGQAKKTECPTGHEYSHVNTYVTPRGHRRCRACNRDRARRMARKCA